MLAGTILCAVYEYPSEGGWNRGKLEGAFNSLWEAQAYVASCDDSKDLGVVVWSREESEKFLAVAGDILERVKKGKLQADELTEGFGGYIEQLIGAAILWLQDEGEVILEEVAGEEFIYSRYK